MAYQFVHIQTYSLKPMKVSGTKDHLNDLNQVFNEAMREARYSEHVPSPRPRFRSRHSGQFRSPTCAPSTTNGVQASARLFPKETEAATRAG